MLSIPHIALSEDVLQCFVNEGIFDYVDSGTSWILQWIVNESERNFYGEDESLWMNQLLKIRAEILKGDLRSLYIGWLYTVYVEQDNLPEHEPMALPGLAQLTEAQQWFATFIEADLDLLYAAGMGSPALDIPVEDEKSVTQWLSQLPNAVVTPLLEELLTGSASLAKLQLNQLFIQTHTNPYAPLPCAPRTLDVIVENLEQATQIRSQAAKDEADRVEKEKQQARLNYLQDVFQQATQYWSNVDENAEKGSGHSYNAAAKMLNDLRDAYQQNDASAQFRQKVTAFMQPHQKRPALLKRIKDLRLI
jgi:hypothetical protein